MSCVGQRPGSNKKQIDLLDRMQCQNGNCQNQQKEGADGCQGCYDWSNYVPKQQQLDPRRSCH